MNAPEKKPAMSAHPGFSSSHAALSPASGILLACLFNLWKILYL
ncbi:hypothetical protein [Rhodothermus marinus]|nr:hypothetical protein [Rhodothermus marinus]